MSLASRDLAPPAAVTCGVLTVSDSRTLATDGSGRAIETALVGAGHVVVRRLVPDDADQIVGVMRDWLADTSIRVIISAGGTGIARRDVTFEAVRGLLDKELPGFGELFRAASFRLIGPAAMLSRATAGTIGRTVVFVLPGSEAAVRLAMTELILPQLGHLVRELNR